MARRRALLGGDRRGAGHRRARTRRSGGAGDGRSWSAVRPPALPRSSLPARCGRAGRRSSERGLGADQSNSSSVLGRVGPAQGLPAPRAGLNPELELVAFLTEEAGFGAVPPLAGFAEMVSVDAGTSTVAIAQEFVADGATRTRSIAESLTGWLLAPGEVSVEFATEVAADLGTLTAGLHAALADARGIPDFEPRPATRDELRGWARAARNQLSRAIDVAPGEAGRLLRDLAPRIVDELTRPRGAPQPAAAHPGPRRLPPRPGPDRARRLPDRRLRGRAAPPARGAPRPPEPAARRRVDAAVARPRGAQRGPARGGSQRRAASSSRASTSTGGCGAPGSASSTRTERGCARPVRRSSSTRRWSAPSRSRRSATSSSTPPPTCRRGCGRRPRGCAACSSESGRAAILGP